MANIDQNIQELMDTFGNQNSERAERARKAQQALRAIVRVRGGKSGIGIYDPLSKDVKGKTIAQVRSIPESAANLDSTTISMLTVANTVKNLVEKAKNSSRNVVIYAMQENAIRAHRLFAAIRDGKESFSDEDNTNISNFRGDSAESYVAAVEALRATLEDAKASGIYVQVKELDELRFTRLPAEVAKMWKLSGNTVVFKNRTAVLKAGTKLTDGTALGSDLTISGVYAAGVHKLSVQPIGGNRQKKELVAMKDTSASNTIRMLQKLDAALRGAMPTEAEVTVIDMDEIAA